nr:hypothetical protein GCM10020092_091090 [Actinoplanes digitatis]
MLLAGLVIRFGYRVGLSVFGRIFMTHQRVRRRRFYFRDLLFTADAAKEIRVFGLLGWVGERYSDAFMASSVPVWQQRRRIFYGPYVLYTLTAFVLLGGVLAAVARASATGVLGVGAFMIVMQAALSSIRIGAFIAESDVQTEYGMNAQQALTRLGELTLAAADPGGSETPSAELPIREIRFERVTFRYAPDAPPVLDGLDLVIPAGASLAIVGLNGARQDDAGQAARPPLRARVGADHGRRRRHPHLRRRGLAAQGRRDLPGLRPLRTSRPRQRRLRRRRPTR